MVNIFILNVSTLYLSHLQKNATHFKKPTIYFLVSVKEPSHEKWTKTYFGFVGFTSACFSSTFFSSFSFTSFGFVLLNSVICLLPFGFFVSEDARKRENVTNIKPRAWRCCRVTLSVSTQGKLKNIPDHDGNRTYDVWNASPMLCQLSCEVRSFQV